jgi:hypothetical protein
VPLLSTSPSATTASPSSLPMRNPYSSSTPSSGTGLVSPRHATSLPPNAYAVPVKKRGEVELVRVALALFSLPRPRMLTRECILFARACVCAGVGRGV